MMKEGHKIKMVVPGSIGDELELEPGDRVLAAVSYTHLPLAEASRMWLQRMKKRPSL